jgi:hypothetical protein
MSVRFIDLGIDPVYSDPAHPEQNGRHERMHLELKGEATRPPAHSLSPQQRKLDSFLREYNELRPHKALDNIPPVRVHVHSPREYPKKIEQWVYPKHFVVRYVGRNAAIRWKSYYWVMVATPLSGHYVGLEELGNGIWRVFYRHKLLGYLDEKTLRIEDEQGRTKRGRSGNRV